MTYCDTTETVYALGPSPLMTKTSQGYKNICQKSLEKINFKMNKKRGGAL